MRKFDFHNVFAEWTETESEQDNASKIAQETAIYRIANEIYHAMKEAEVSNSRLAELVGKKPAFITRVFKGDHNMTVRTIANLAFALDKEVHFDLRDRATEGYSWENVQVNNGSNIADFPMHLHTSRRVDVDEFQVVEA